MFDFKKKNCFEEQQQTTKTTAVSYACNCYYCYYYILSHPGDHLFAPLASHNFGAKGTWNGLWGGAGRRCSVLLEQARGLGEAMIWKETFLGSIDANGKETPLQNTSRQHIVTFCCKMFIEVHFRCGANAVLRCLRYFKDLHSVFNREVHFECWFQVLYLFCIHWTKILNLLCAGSLTIPDCLIGHKLSVMRSKASTLPDGHLLLLLGDTMNEIMPSPQEITLKKRYQHQTGCCCPLNPNVNWLEPKTSQDPSPTYFFTNTSMAIAPGGGGGL